MAGLGRAATVATAGPANAHARRRVTTIVVVSGANGGAGGDTELTLRGHRVLGVDLPGHTLADANGPVVLWSRSGPGRGGRSGGDRGVSHIPRTYLRHTRDRCPRTVDILDAVARRQT